ERYLSAAHEAAIREGDVDMQIISSLATAAAKRERGDFVGAEAELRAAAAFVSAHFPEDHPARRGLLLETGLTRLAAGALQEAKSALTQATAQYSRMKTPITNEVQSLAGLARVEVGLGDLQAAAAHAAQARSLADRFAIPGAPSYWIGYALLAQAKV